MPHALLQLHPLILPGPFDMGTLLVHEPPLRWRPEPGDRVVGELAKIVEKSSFGSTAPTMYLLTADGRYVTVRASGVVLRGALDRAKPQPGEQVVLKYEGMQESAAGRQYSLYRFAVRRDGVWLVAS